METPLTNPTEEMLARAVHENLVALFRVMSTLPQGEWVESEKLGMFHTVLTSPMFKGVWQTRLAADETDAAIDETLAWFKARQAPYFFWWTDSQTTPDDLGQRLLNRGLVSYEVPIESFPPNSKTSDFGAPCMAADLSQMNESVLSQLPENFAIDKVASESDLQDFKTVFMQGYGMPEWAAQAWVEATLQFGIEQAPWTMYVGRLAGQPVATNLLFHGAGVVGVFGIANVPAARGKGIGAAITLKPLLDSRALGYRYAVLFSSEMGFSVYQRIGFRDCGVKLNRYVWRNPEA